METEVISIALAVVALVAAAASLTLQARDHFVSRHQGIRSAQLELVRMAIDDPTLYLGYEPPEEERVHFRHRGFVNLFIKYFELGFLTGTLREAEVQHQIRRLFASDGPRMLWPEVRTTWRVEATTRRRKKFVKLVENEFRRAGHSLKAEG
jgi:hypothetical protein